jgi:serine/threonine-protein kinase
VWALLWAFALFLNNVVGPILSPEVPLDDAWPLPGNPVAILVIILSLGLFGYTRHHACDCSLVLHLGLFYMVAVAFAIGLVNQWTPNTVGLSWICILILIHPVIAPNRRRYILIASMAAASMDLVGIAITRARGVLLPSYPEILWYVLPNYICALLAVYPAHILSRLGREVSRARELGSYRLGELLGRGGMGEVYIAHHRMLRRPAAVKLIGSHAMGANGGDSKSVIRRFRKEAEVIASLHSAHTIVLYDFGTTRSGDFYYVMELLQGLDFETLVERFGPVKPERAVHLLRQACHSLAEAHAFGLVHRDIKPSNLFACRVGLETDFVKVLDFGLAKGGFEPGENQARITAPDITTGTPAYMAPEMVRGRDVDGRADIYALGCVGFWLLTGRMVFEADSPTQMILAHVENQPEPPSAIAEFEIPEKLDNLLLSCLEKDPDLRPQSAEELAEQLIRCSGEKSWAGKAADRWWRENLPT